jgi:hypothetical protein
MARKQQLTKALDRIGATLDDVGEGIYVLDAPAGMLWHTGTHSILAEHDPVHERIAEFWDDLLDDATQPLTRCNGWQDELPENGPCERCEADGLPVGDDAAVAA